MEFSLKWKAIFLCFLRSLVSNSSLNSEFLFMDPEKLFGSRKMEVHNFRYSNYWKEFYFREILSHFGKDWTQQWVQALSSHDLKTLVPKVSNYHRNLVHLMDILHCIQVMGSARSVSILLPKNLPTSNFIKNLFFFLFDNTLTLHHISDKT